MADDTTSTRNPAPRLILAASSVALGVPGVALLFAPAETAALFGWSFGAHVTGLAAGGLLALAILNWAGRGAVYGGIYGRPIVLANLTFALTGGLTLFNLQLDGAVRSLVGWVPVAVVALHGVSFGLLLTGRLRS